MGAENPVVLLTFKSGNQLNDCNYAEFAENCIKNFLKQQEQERRSEKLTTSKLRSVYALIMNVYARVNSADDFEKCKSDLQYIKVKMAYESGRTPAVKQFLGNKATFLMAALDYVKTYEQFLLYCRYAESLVAYFKFYGGEE